ncbi:unnamed protein product [Didymodactylos carnosus]|uniref:G-protein coupled receptors family 1 profile domain-containing protein n=1 Tax=Didymodactylos carnosus TaxID=1234261 RepID=A0A815X9N0_9BILA|nr:unnamed protein product [Didymodactylos carnosus]CAF1554707.1 unnamed protein product [Didymodactylos carnosus]CAF4063706.1 unnamed protein product [Didymodactylos carnosus]CAF4415877.1 unnamed protein product [Didymodactylos carnosus]
MIISCLFLSMVAYNYRQLKQKIPILLSCNTCVAVLFTSIALSSICASNLNRSPNSRWCLIAGYLNHTFNSSIYYAYTLQAFYRLCRIIFNSTAVFKKKKTYSILICIQWSFSLLTMSTALICNWIVFLSSEFYCQVIYSNLVGALYLGLLLYQIPMASMGSMYVWIARFIRQSARTARQQQKRDLIIIKRMFTVVGVLTLMGVPPIVFFMIWLITGHVFSISYAIQWMTFSITLILINIVLIGLTPQLKAKLKHQIIPIVCCINILKITYEM